MIGADAARDREIATYYDNTPYLSVAIPETHPSRLAAVARLMGLNPAPVKTCRVLELGCAGGGNLVPMAVGLPDGQFVGVDISPGQIAQASAFAAECGATNVDFYAKNISEISLDLGIFDYILCHGVYSWVPDDVKSAILRLCSENLAETGVAFVSYNVYPGWHVPAMIREMMLYHIRGVEDATTRAKSARSFLNYLAESTPDRDGNFARSLRDESKQLDNHEDSYILHEHLETINDPVYYHQFIEHVESHGLKVFADARFFSMALAVQPPFRQVLDRFASNSVDREQYLDFLCNRRFRRSLLCHSSVKPASEADAAALDSLAVSSLVRPTTLPIEIVSNKPIDFFATDGNKRMTASDIVTKAAFSAIIEVGPDAIPFGQLLKKVQQILADTPDRLTTSAEKLAMILLQLYSGNAIGLHDNQPPIEITPSEHPRAFAAARVSADQHFARIPNLWHDLPALSRFDTLVLRQCNGKRTHQEIVDALVAAVSDGEFPIHQNNVSVTEPALTRPILERSLAPSLARLARNAFLMK